MNEEEKERMNRGKTWCFDNGVTEERVKNSWNNSLQLGNMLVKNHNKHGRDWWCLPVHLLEQLIERY